jgi:hypothetical protein
MRMRLCVLEVAINPHSTLYNISYPWDVFYRTRSSVCRYYSEHYRPTICLRGSLLSVLLKTFKKTWRRDCPVLYCRIASSGTEFGQCYWINSSWTYTVYYSLIVANKESGSTWEEAVVVFQGSLSFCGVDRGSVRPHVIYLPDGDVRRAGKGALLAAQHFSYLLYSLSSGYGLDDRAIEIRSPAGAKDFLSSFYVQTGSGAYPASCPMGTGGPFPGSKARPGRDADQSPPSSAKVVNE